MSELTSDKAIVIPHLKDEEFRAKLEEDTMVYLSDGGKDFNEFTAFLIKWLNDNMGVKE